MEAVDFSSKSLNKVSALTVYRVSVYDEEAWLI